MSSASLEISSPRIYLSRMFFIERLCQNSLLDWILFILVFPLDLVIEFVLYLTLFGIVLGNVGISVPCEKILRFIWNFTEKFF